MATEFIEHRAAVVVGAGVIGLEVDRAIVTVNRLMMPFELEKHATQIIVSGSVGRIDRNKPCKPLLSLRQAPGLQGNHAQQKQGVWCVTRFSEYLPANLLGQSGIPALQGGKSLLHPLLQIRHARGIAA
jgi:hypothetical protein